MKTEHLLRLICFSFASLLQPAPPLHPCSPSFIHSSVCPPPPLSMSPCFNVSWLPRLCPRLPAHLIGLRRVPCRRDLVSRVRPLFHVCPQLKTPGQGTWIIPACIGLVCSPTFSQQEKAQRRIEWKRSALNYLMRSQPANQSEAENSLM